MPLFDNEVTIQEVVNLQATLDEKAAVDHNHLPDTWQNILLASRWLNYGTGYTTPQCRKFMGRHLTKTYVDLEVAAKKWGQPCFVDPRFPTTIWIEGCPHFFRSWLPCLV